MFSAQHTESALKRAMAHSRSQEVWLQSAHLVKSMILCDSFNDFCILNDCVCVLRSRCLQVSQRLSAQYSALQRDKEEHDTKLAQAIKSAFKKCVAFSQLFLPLCLLFSSVECLRLHTDRRCGSTRTNWDATRLLKIYRFAFAFIANCRKVAPSPDLELLVISL